MARVRSPNFPVISLPAAIERIEKIYAREQTVPADRETIAAHLGYSGINGASLKVISALGKYGLLEEMPDKTFRVSPLALAIMHPASDEEKADALREAASGPALFQKLDSMFDGKRPSETNLRSWLLRNGFATSAVASVISAYSETMDLVSGLSEVYKASEAPVGQNAVHAAERHHRMQAATVGSPIPLNIAPLEPFSVELLKGRVRVVGDLVTREDAQTLLDFLRSAMAFLPEKTTSPGFQAEDMTQGSDLEREEDDDDAYY